jgi:hypothetical protein
LNVAPDGEVNLSEEEEDILASGVPGSPRQSAVSTVG